MMSAKVPAQLQALAQEMEHATQKMVNILTKLSLILFSINKKINFQNVLKERGKQLALALKVLELAAFSPTKLVELMCSIIAHTSGNYHEQLLIILI